MDNNRNSFIFYRSFFEAIDDLSNSQQLEIYRSISDYSLNFNEPQLDGISKAIFTLIKPQLEANKKKYLNGSKGAEHGIKGGRPKPKKTPKKPLKNPTLTPNVNVNDNVNDNVNNKKEELKKDFERIYKIYNRNKKIRVFPFDGNKIKFQKCIDQLGGVEELEKQMINYLKYLEIATWRKKKAFDAWINSPSIYANDWESELVSESDTKRTSSTSTNATSDLIKRVTEAEIQKREGQNEVRKIF